MAMAFRLLFTITWYLHVYGGMVDKLVGVVEKPLEPLFEAVPGEVKKILDEQLDSITKYVDEIPEIGENAFDIIDIAQDLVSVFTEAPFSLKDGDEQFANTLKDCLNQFRDIVNPLSAFDDVIQIKEFNFISPMPDVEDMTYKLLAVALGGMKQLIEFTCTDVLPDAIEFTKQILEGSIARRRRRLAVGEGSRPDWVDSKQECFSNTFPTDFMPEEDNCATIPAERFCESPDDKYFYDTLDSAGGDVYAAMVKFYSPIICDINGKAVGEENMLLASPYDNSNTEVFNRFRIAKLLFEIIHNLVDAVCGAIDGCIQDTAECPVAPKCAAAKAIIYSVNSIFDWILGNVAAHDGEVNNMRLKSIFKDRITIIHNQKAILMALQKGVLGITTSVEAAENAEKYTLKKAIEGLGKLQDDFNDQYPGAQTEKNMKIDGRSNVEDRFIEINMKRKDLYVFCAAFVGCNFVFIIIGMVVMGCYMRYNLDSSGKRQTYEYCPSEIE